MAANELGGVKSPDKQHLHGLRCGRESTVRQEDEPKKCSPGLDGAGYHGRYSLSIQNQPRAGLVRKCLEYRWGDDIVWTLGEDIKHLVIDGPLPSVLE